MKYKIPKYLYRGDSDLRNKRLLKSTLHHYQLQTNLINGGEGREITEKPLIDLIDKHVNIGWEHTHFLSFSECEKTAIRFGINCETEDVESKFEEYYQSEQKWDFALITIDTDRISFTPIEIGVYVGFFNPSLSEFSNNTKYKIFLINVVEYLTIHSGYEISKFNSTRDEEWLILPATMKQLNYGVEYSAILDGSIIYEVKKFKKN